MSQTTLTSKGQVTIPKAVREALDLRTGDRIDFIVNEAGEAVLRRVSRSVEQIQGMLAHRAGSPISIEAMDEAVRQRFRPRR